MTAFPKDVYLSQKRCFANVYEQNYNAKRREISNELHFIGGSCMFSLDERINCVLLVVCWSSDRQEMDV